MRAMFMAWTTRISITMNKQSYLRRFYNFLFIDDAIKRAQFESASDVYDGQVLYSSFSLQFSIILGAATLISSIGLMSDSSVTIVGAMLIAPLMKPIMSLSYGITIGDGLLKLRSLITLILGILITLSISFIAEQILDLHILTTEMVNRIEPNLFDLGVAIAAGTAAALAMTRKSVSDSLPGVAIAVAIVPPLCVSGVSLSMGEMHAFLGSLLLFAINLFAITISAVLVFIVSGYGSIKHTLIPVPFIILILLSLAYPLRESIELIEKDDLIQSTIETWLHDNYPSNVDIHPGDLNEIGIIDKPDHTFVYLELKAAKDALSPAQISHIHSLLETALASPVNLKIQFLLTQELMKYSHTLKDGKAPIYGKDAIISRK